MANAENFTMDDSIRGNVGSGNVGNDNSEDDSNRDKRETVDSRINDKSKVIKKSPLEELIERIEKNSSIKVVRENFTKSEFMEMNSESMEKTSNCSEDWSMEETNSESEELLETTVKRKTRKKTKGKSFVCDICGKNLSTKYVLINHRLGHTGEKPFVCDVCGKSFSQDAHLAKHLRVHTGEKPYPCKICGKGFSQSASVKYHMRVHTGEKPYACSVCGKAFAENSNLTQHMRTHTKEKPFECEECGMTFSRNGFLQKHMLSHTGEVQFPYVPYGNSFKQSQSYEQYSTGGKPFSCTECGKAFAQEGYLRRHMQSIHGEGKNFSWMGYDEHNISLSSGQSFEDNMVEDYASSAKEDTGVRENEVKCLDEAATLNCEVDFQD